MKLAALLFAGIGLLLQQSQPFRSQANVTAIDVTVTDGKGHVVRNLGPDDFIVTARKQARRVLTADFVEVRTESARVQILPEAGLAPSKPSSNRTSERGRVFILAIDTSMIGLGDGRVQMQQVSEFLDHLAPEDLVGLVSLPTFTPRVELTRDRAPIRDALNSVVGASNRYASCSPTYGEAAAISLGDTKSASKAMLDRLGMPPRCAGGTANSRVVIPEYRIHTSGVLDSLGALSDALKSTPGLKTIVLVAEGMFANDDNRDDIARLATRTEAAGTRVYALHLETPYAEARTNGNVTSTHALDDHYGFDAMAEVATATGGTAFRVVGSVIPRLDQIDEESSGYYVLGIEVDPADTSNKAVELSVKSRRPGLDIRARRMFTTRPATIARPPSTTDGDARATAEMLQSPISVGEIPIDVDVVSSYAPSNHTAVRHVILADIPSPEDIVAVGFSVATLAGRSIAYKIEAPVLLAATGGAPFLAALDLEPGAYRLRLALIAGNGARGSVERVFSAKPATERPGISDIFLGLDNSTPWKPIAAPVAGQKRLGVRVELSAADYDPASSNVKLLLGRMGQQQWIEQHNLTINGNGPVRTASGAIDLAQLEPGRFVLKVELWRGGVLAASTAKAFDIR